MNEDRIEWDYKGYQSESSNFWTQKDWIQTLIARINQISAQIGKKSYRGGANKIEAHTRFKPLFQMMEYFHEGNDGPYSLSARYEVTFTDHTLKNSIKVWHEQKHVPEGLVMLPTKETIAKGPEAMGEISFNIRKLDDEGVQEYLSSLRDDILIKNFTDKDSEHLAKFVAEEKARIKYPTPNDVVVNARDIRLKESLSSEVIIESNNELGVPKWDTEHEQVDNKTMLENYIKNFDGPKGIIFYFVRISSGYNSYTRKIEYNDINAKSIFLDLRDFEGSLAKMDEISSGDRFHSWAGSHKPINQLPEWMAKSDAKVMDDFVNEIRESANLQGKPEKLRAHWTPEMAQDISGLYQVEAEKELISILSERIGEELAAWGGKEKLANCEKTDDFFSRMKELGYELGPVVCDPNTFCPMRTFYRSDKLPEGFDPKDELTTIGKKSDSVSFKTGGMLEDELRKAMNTPLINPETGQINLKYDPQHVEEDIYIGLRDESPTSNVAKLTELANSEFERFKVFKTMINKEDVINSAVKYALDNFDKFNPDKGKYSSYFRTVLRTHMIKQLS